MHLNLVMSSQKYVLTVSLYGHLNDFEMPEDCERERMSRYARASDARGSLRASANPEVHTKQIRAST